MFFLLSLRKQDIAMLGERLPWQVGFLFHLLYGYNILHASLPKTLGMMFLSGFTYMYWLSFDTMEAPLYHVYMFLSAMVMGL